MAAIRALVASRLAVTAAFAPRPGLRALPFGGPAPFPRAALHASAPRPVARVAVVLSGCGVYDGTELHEASSILVHLSRAGAEVQIFAPDIPQMHVIDHTKGQPSEGEARSTFAVDGGDCKVNKDVERVLKEFHQAGKPIGLCCVAPVLAARVLGSVEVTVGHEQEEGGKWPHAGTAQVIKALGAKHCVTGVTEAHVDQKNKVVTTPAFMCDAAFHHIHDGIGAMVRKVLELASK
ncbi:glutamine amidotransferase-like class 1 domain-containing protein 3, mitochondrial isoform X1 [Kogia breviceps]|uniref:glutamine amidotransferase-like class 1 domain-containing protein 3, mitochondrial isoform X1 n=1 Tax=Kogia breviceps TaxID=27615 RepID=UPI0034D2B871